MLKTILIILICSIMLIACQKRYTDIEIATAVCSNDYSTVENYLKQGNDPNKVLNLEESGQLKLIDVLFQDIVCRGDVKLFQLLVDHGVMINTPEYLSTAVAYFTPAVEHILKLGVDPNERYNGSIPLVDIGVKTRFDRSLEVHEDWLDTVKILVSYGADPTIPLNTSLTNTEDKALSFIDLIETGEFRIVGVVEYLESLGHEVNLSPKAKKFYREFHK